VNETGEENESHAIPGIAEPRRRGRPPGSKSKPPVALQAAAEA
jgi:hypothetical protein